MKTFKVTKNVEIKNPDGSVRVVVPVELNGYIDELSGEKSFAVLELMKLDRIRARYAGIMLPDEIRALRNRFNKTQEEMSIIIGAGIKTWTRWETGASIPNPSMCKALFLLRDGRISLDDLCTQSEKCFSWFGANRVCCEKCKGLASQFAAMKGRYVKEINPKEVSDVPNDIEVAA